MSVFGLAEQAKIQKSKIRQIFTPHQPINSVALFFGRQSEVAQIIDAMLTPGEHAVLFGDRGVGKSSLANISSVIFLEKLVGTAISIRCDEETTFKSLSRNLLKKLGVDVASGKIKESKEVSTEGGVSIPGLKAGAGTARGAAVSKAVNAHATNPAAVAEAIAGNVGLVIIDEFDAVRDREDRRRVAQLIKQLSDGQSLLKILVVGIGESCADLMAGHASVQRCVREVHLGRMTSEEVQALLQDNAKKAKLRIDPQVVETIVRLSSGYPYFAQLLGLKAAEVAVIDDRKDIRGADLPRAIRSAVEDAEESLRRAYAESTRSAGTQMFRKIVHAAAEFEKPEFTASELRARLSAAEGRTVTQNELNNHFQRLVSSDGAKILTRETKGVYRFSDPRMKSYVRINQIAN